MESNVLIIIAIGVASLFGLWLIFYFIPVGLWFSALVSGVRISLLQLVLMRWRKIPPAIIVNSLIAATKAGLKLNRNELEAHYLAGNYSNEQTNRRNCKRDPCYQKSQNCQFGNRLTHFNPS
jgi:uncharacterized protein YqfA (UPF0365 family)